MQSNAKTVKEYIDELPEERKQIIRRIDEVIHQAAPELSREGETFMLYGMIGYGRFHYKYASGREGDWAIVGLASQKNYVSVYLSAADEKGYLAERNKQRLGKVSVGKSCIRFKHLEDLDLDVLSGLIKESVRMARAGNFAI